MEAGLRLSPNAEAHLKTPKEMQRLYKGYEDALARTMEVVDACRFSLDELAYDYPREPVPAGLNTHSNTWKNSAMKEPTALSRRPARQRSKKTSSMN